MSKPKQLEFLTVAQVAAHLDLTAARVGQLTKTPKNPTGELTVAAELKDGTRLYDPALIEAVKQARIKKLLARVEVLRST